MTNKEFYARMAARKALGLFCVGDRVEVDPGQVDRATLRDDQLLAIDNGVLFHVYFTYEDGRDILAVILPFDDSPSMTVPLDVLIHASP